MALNDDRPVKKERSGWRDEAIIRRHRDWGFNVPTADLDWLVCEYDRRQTVALIEYKNQHARQVTPKEDANIQAVKDLADRAQVPFFAVRYSDGLDIFRVVPLNYLAKSILNERVLMSEFEYVSFLYRLRGREIPPNIVAQIRVREVA